MTKLLSSVAVGAAALFEQCAGADVFTTTQLHADEAPVVENVRMVCNEFGRCWREPSCKTIINERDSVSGISNVATKMFARRRVSAFALPA